MRKRASCLIGALLLGSGRILLAQDAVSSARLADRDRPDVMIQSAPLTPGVTFPVAFSTEVLGNLAGGDKRTAIWESLLNVGLTLDLEKLAGWKGGSVSIGGLYAAGSGLTTKAVNDFNTLSNIDAYDSVRLYDAWPGARSQHYHLLRRHRSQLQRHLSGSKPGYTWTCL